MLCFQWNCRWQGLNQTPALDSDGIGFPDWRMPSEIYCRDLRAAWLSGIPGTTSQNGRGWKGPLWVTQPNPLPKQGHPEQAAQHHVQAGREYLQRRRLHRLPGQTESGLRHPQREEVLPHVQMELPLLQFVPVAPCPVTGHHWKESGPILLTPTLQIFISIYKVPSQPSPG